MLNDDELLQELKRRLLMAKDVVNEVLARPVGLFSSPK